MSRTRDRITVGKAHAFDMGYTADELKTAWDTVKKILKIMASLLCLYLQI